MTMPSRDRAAATPSRSCVVWLLVLAIGLSSLSPILRGSITETPMGVEMLSALPSAPPGSAKTDPGPDSEWSETTRLEVAVQSLPVVLAWPPYCTAAHAGHLRRIDRPPTS